jgi:hypothetical protein
MVQEDSSEGWLSGIVSLIKMTIIAIVFWFIVGAGMCGLYYWYKREVMEEDFDEQRAERFGNKVFLAWAIITLIASHWVYDSPTPEIFDQMFKALVIVQGIFFGFCSLGLLYMWKRIL